MSMPQGKAPVWVVIAGGGTAGHVYPGLAVAQALQRRGYEAEAIHFVGSVRGVEQALVPAARFGLSLLPGRGIQRRVSLQNIKSLWGLAQAVKQAKVLLQQLNPAVVLSVGGYASVACVLAAKRLGIPLVVAEQNAVPGLANRLASRWARVAAVAFPDTLLPRSTLIGNPVRQEIQVVNRHTQRDEARAALGLDSQRFLVAAVSGSLGAARLNRAVFEAARAWFDRDDLSIYHVVGKRDWNDLASLRPDLSVAALEYRAVEYCEQMADVYAAADLLVGRAGASSVAELTVVGLASVLVPLPGAPGDHQTANAAHLATQGAAVQVADHELDERRLMAEVNKLLEDPPKLAAMGDKARSLGHPDADERLADLLERHACSRPNHHSTSHHSPALDSDTEVSAVSVLDSISRIHLLGIGGAGMSGLAVLLQQMGKAVSGSDLAASAVLDRLHASGVEVFVGHQASQVNGSDLVVRSTAVGDANPEVLAAQAAGIAVWRRAEMLQAITVRCATVAVAGTHGKTTTSAMLAHILSVTGHDPSYLVGAALAGGSIGARWSGPDCFIIEADESDGTFEELRVIRGVLTSVEPDHLRSDRNPANLQAEFGRFCAGATHGLVVCADDAGALQASEGCERVLYGTAAFSDYRLQMLSQNGRSSSSKIYLASGEILALDVPMAGQYNALNALGALTMACELGVEAAAGVAAVADFAGVARRFERRGEVAGVEFIDDYAHLPTEVSCALRAAREGIWKRVVCVFQPHRYTRTLYLWRDFARSFDLADVTILTDIYSAGEPEIPGVSGQLIWQAVNQANPGQDITYIASLDEVAQCLVDVLRPGDLCLTLGAGDLTDIPDQVMAMFQEVV
ncbi:MAG: UDP-N-acetylmuramate--L-alanine ligase [Acidimicrobiia bacterium]|nr:UDP-N-acetylmuramate--L-alanine ligase [Acidimicrobiia bacterium]MYC56984.1 UDP-N-acetylmuramate--L-alanine ligase [Acidimicrobiia bacterium]MYG94084.1 UDP-N-acetylmuramate--L-alanine ligase [Acidimicrobiia bacterium]MYI30849.1 UDP-N-acetylmuramate--L-alanine ligase [Acidimicrobiia bacterium]